MSLSQNQFLQSPVQGQVDQKFGPGTIPCQIDTSSVGSLPAGQAVKLVDSSGGVPKVVECAADTDDVYGFIVYDIKSQLFNAGDRVEIMGMRNGVMYMTASAAIARGAKVMVVLASDKIATATTGKTIIGRAFDKASADGDLIRVTVDLPGSAA